MHCNPDFPADIVPVDVAMNAIIAAAWERGLKQENEDVDFRNIVSGIRFVGRAVGWSTIFHLFINIFRLFFQTLAHDKQLTWGQAVEQGRQLFHKNPLCFSLWYPDGSIKSNYWQHLFCVIFFHYLPAYFIDGLLVLTRQKPLYAIRFCLQTFIYQN